MKRDPFCWFKWDNLSIKENRDYNGLQHTIYIKIPLVHYKSKGQNIFFLPIKKGPLVFFFFLRDSLAVFLRSTPNSGLKQFFCHCLLSSWDYKCTNVPCWTLSFNHMSLFMFINSTSADYAVLIVPKIPQYSVYGFSTLFFNI
jgi:hypothetical protein